MATTFEVPVISNQGKRKTSTVLTSLPHVIVFSSSSGKLWLRDKIYTATFGERKAVKMQPTDQSVCKGKNTQNIVLKLSWGVPKLK